MFTSGECRRFILLLVIFASRKWVALGEPLPTPTTPPDGGRCSPHYAIHQWSSANGLPASTIQCLLQTHDGYLWIGTRVGLVRFNGGEFRSFPGINCRCLAEDSDGGLWIGGSDQLLHWDGVVLKSYRIPAS